MKSALLSRNVLRPDPMTEAPCLDNAVSGGLQSTKHRLSRTELPLAHVHSITFFENSELSKVEEIIQLSERAIMRLNGPSEVGACSVFVALPKGKVFSRFVPRRVSRMRVIQAQRLSSFPSLHIMKFLFSPLKSCFLPFQHRDHFYIAWHQL